MLKVFEKAGTDVPRAMSEAQSFLAGPSSSWAFKQLSIIYKIIAISMCSAMGHLSLSYLMKRETSKMTKVLLQHQERLNQ